MSVTKPKPEGFTTGPQSHSYNAICPYCGASYQVESEDYSEFDRDEECFECGKTYTVRQSFEVETHTCPKEAGA